MSAATTLGPVCATLQQAVSYQQSALDCALARLRQRDLPPAQERQVRGWQDVFLADAHVLLCLVASTAAAGNEAEFGAAARSTPR